MLSLICVIQGQNFLLSPSYSILRQAPFSVYEVNCAMCAVLTLYYLSNEAKAGLTCLLLDGYSSPLMNSTTEVMNVVSVCVCLCVMSFIV